MMASWHTGFKRKIGANAAYFVYIVNILVGSLASGQRS